jgi:RNA recognition motif-containing protein
MASINIFVGNLSMDITDNELKGMFSPFGMVTSSTIMNDRYIGSGQLRSYGYIEMPSKNDGEAAIISLNGTVYRGRDINVIEAMPQNRVEETIPSKARVSRSKPRNR